MTEAHIDEENLKRVGGLRTINGIKVAGWLIDSTHGVMLKDSELEELKERLGGVFKTPEIVFGYNSLRLHHLESGLEISFNAFDALKEWSEEKLPPLQVKLAKSWQTERNDDIEAHQAKFLNYDWTFTSPYSGSFTVPNNAEFLESEVGVDYELLKRKDPILYYNEIPLYASELDDNGTCQFEVLIRVMPQAWFIISRFFLRVDNNLIRLKESRLFAKLSNELPLLVVKEQKHWDCTFDEIQEKIASLSESVRFHDVASSISSLHSIYPNGTHLNIQQVLSVSNDHSS